MAWSTENILRRYVFMLFQPQITELLITRGCNKNSSKSCHVICENGYSKLFSYWFTIQKFYYKEILPHSWNISRLFLKIDVRSDKMSECWGNVINPINREMFAREWEKIYCSQYSLLFLCSWIPGIEMHS